MKHDYDYELEEKKGEKTKAVFLHRFAQDGCTDCTNVGGFMDYYRNGAPQNHTRWTKCSNEDFNKGYIDGLFNCLTSSKSIYKYK